MRTADDENHNYDYEINEGATLQRMKRIRDHLTRVIEALEAREQIHGFQRSNSSFDELWNLGFEIVTKTHMKELDEEPRRGHVPVFMVRRPEMKPYQAYIRGVQTKKVKK